MQTGSSKKEPHAKSTDVHTNCYKSKKEFKLDVLSQNTLVQGAHRLDYNAVSKLNFGNYVQVRKSNDVTNTTRGRTVSAIALYLLQNVQGSWYFISLVIWERIHQY